MADSKTNRYMSIDEETKVFLSLNCGEKKKTPLKNINIPNMNLPSWMLPWRLLFYSCLSPLLPLPFIAAMVWNAPGTAFSKPSIMETLNWLYFFFGGRLNVQKTLFTLRWKPGDFLSASRFSSLFFPALLGFNFVPSPFSFSPERL